MDKTGWQVHEGFLYSQRLKKKKIRGYSWTLTRALPKKSTLNENRKIIPETPQMHPCYFSNIPTRFPPQGLCPLLFPLLGMLFTHMSTWLAPSLFQISTLRSPWPSYIKQQNPNTNILAHSIPPALLYLFHSTYHALQYKMFVYCVYLPPQSKVCGGIGFDCFHCLYCQILNTYLLNEWMN